MSSNNTVWLSNYRDRHFIDIYGVIATFPGISKAKTFYHLNKKDDEKTLSELEKEDFRRELDKSLSIRKTWFAGKYIKDKNMPNLAYQKPYEDLPKPDEVAFQITNGYLVVNKTCYEVISQFNLGKTHFSKIEILDMETDKKVIDKDYYFINIAETREFLDSESSEGVQRSRNRPIESQIRFISNPKDNEIKLENVALDNEVDLWHDPKLVDSLFLSNKLVQALFNAGIKQSDLALVRCEINQ